MRVSGDMHDLTCQENYHHHHHHIRLLNNRQNAVAQTEKKR